MSKREELIREYCRQVNESLHFIQKYMEGIVPAGRCSEELYWETKKISEELQKSNHEQTALIRAYLREAAQLYVEGEPWKRTGRATGRGSLWMAVSPGDSGCAES